MHFQNTFIFLGTFITNVYAQTQVSVSYDRVYDNAAEPIANVACSNSFGSLTTLGQIPAFANIGGSPTVSGYGSSNCGKCYALTYQGTTVNVLAIDTGSRGFNIALGAMNRLTNGQGVVLGRVNAVYTEVPTNACVPGPPSPGTEVGVCSFTRRKSRKN